MICICMGRECPDCGSEDFEERTKGGFFSREDYFVCMSCGHTFG